MMTVADFVDLMSRQKTARAVERARRPHMEWVRSLPGPEFMAANRAIRLAHSRVCGGR